jgi:hypothetical protein
MSAQVLSIGDGSSWTFAGEAWTDAQEGVILPPAKSREYGPHSFQAFNNDVVAYDLEVELDFRINGQPSFCEPRLIVRAQDPACYYAIGFPAVGQSWRAKAVWAAIWRVEANGMHYLLDMRQVLGVVAEHGRWYHGHVTCHGPEISFSIEGRPVVSVRDETYGAGRVGFGAWGPAEFRNVQVRTADASPVSSPAWDAQRRPAVPWSFAQPVEGDSINQGCHAIRRLPSGRLLMWLGQDGQVTRLCSDDAGRTWGDAQVVKAGSLKAEWNAANASGAADPDAMEGSLAQFILPDGRVRALYQPTRDARQTFVLDSPDEGVTFGEPKPVTIHGDWPKLPDRWLAYSLLVTPAGEVLRFTYTEPLPHTQHLGAIGGGGMTWAATASQAFCMRSADGGDTWSAPVPLDNVSWPGEDRHIESSFDATESAACMTAGGRICCMIRPSYSALMWQTWSDDGGQTWEPMAFAPFPGYQCAATRTSSGALVFCMRFPCMTVYVSHDDGVTWHGTMIDYASQGPEPGAMLEVEPEVIMIGYTTIVGPRRARVQRLRVTATGVEPA